MPRRPSAVIAAVLLAGVVGCGGADEPASGSPREASVVDVDEIREQVRDITVDSPALGFEARVRLLLPAGFETDTDRRYPVLYLLHGCCDTYSSWTNNTNIEDLAVGLDLIVAIPDGGPAGFYSDWVEGPQWEQFHLGELLDILETDYRAGDVRAVAGLSMGGLGALSYAARNPGLFAAAASYSGVVHTTLTGGTSQNYLTLVSSQGEEPRGLWGDPRDEADVWAAHNPYDLAEELRGTALYLSVGTGEPGPLDRPDARTDPNEVALLPQNEAFAARLAELDIPATLSFYGPGTHSWPYWERELNASWPLLLTALGLA